MEAFHLLTPDSICADRLRDFILDAGLTVWLMDHGAVVPAFELMEQYRDHPMDLADASLIVAAESLRTIKLFTLGRKTFASTEFAVDIAISKPR